jgi:hypothetical protein
MAQTVQYFILMRHELGGGKEFSADAAASSCYKKYLRSGECTSSRNRNNPELPSAPAIGISSSILPTGMAHRCPMSPMRPLSPPGRFVLMILGSEGRKK